MTKHPPSHYPDIGALGEDLVVKWLAECGWDILHRRWRCRLGEIDIIAEYGGIKGVGKEISSNTLAFIEVKTRSAGSWDTGGRDAVTLRKQQKVWHTAQMFLLKYPQKAEFNCRFDVAIVFSIAISKELDANQNSQSLASTTISGYNLVLQDIYSRSF